MFGNKQHYLLFGSSTFWQPYSYRHYGLCNLQNGIYAPLDFCYLDDALQFFVNLVCHEADADVGFYAFLCKMEYGSRFKIALCNTESSFHDQKSMVLLYDFCWFQICVRDIPFQPIPCGASAIFSSLMMTSTSLLISRNLLYPRLFTCDFVILPLA